MSFYLYKMHGRVVGGKQSAKALPPPAIQVSKEEYLAAGFSVEDEAIETPEQRADRLEKENKLLKAQLQAQVNRSDFIEDCIAEMAMAVYGEV